MKGWNEVGRGGMFVGIGCVGRQACGRLVHYLLEPPQISRQLIDSAPVPVKLTFWTSRVPDAT